MLGLGWTEMLVIGVVALIFIGPKDLPMVMGKVGKVIGQIQRMGRDFQREINKTTGLDEVRNLRNSITQPLKQTADEIRREFNTMTPNGPKPSGAIKPADPHAESVVDEIREKAGMAPAKKSSDELAAEYGFKPSEPVKAARPQLPAKTEIAAPDAAKAEAAKPEPGKAPRVKAAKPKPAAKAATATDTPKVANAKVASPKDASPKAGPAETAPAPTSEAKPARKPRSKSSASAPAEATVSADKAKPAAKPRAPRKKPADTAGKN